MIEPKMLAYLDIQDRDAVDDWARQHFEWHEVIATTALKKGYPKFSTYPALRDMLGDLDGWAYYHNLSHLEAAAALQFGEIADLSEIYPDDQDAMDSWLEIHSEIHQDMRSVLGIV